MARPRLAMLVATMQLASAQISDEETCPGAINMSGYGMIQVVATKWNVPGELAAKVDVIDGKVLPNLKGRSYFADSCQGGKFDAKDYLALPLLGKALRFTVDLSEAGCGCNAAFYLTNLHQNYNISGCEDYYCDANSVCGVPCAEIDVMEANKKGWHSTLHTADDKFGVGGGYGGGGPGWNGARDWTSAQYGPNGTCIDTDLPFQVTASFPISRGLLSAMTITLSQVGQPCNLSLRITDYDGNTTKHRKGERRGMLEVTQALTAGMTPIASFWESKAMLWLDGEGEDGLGPCSKDLVSACPDKVPMYDFSVETLPPPEQGFSSTATIAIVIVVAAVVVLAIGLWYLTNKDEDRYFEQSDESGSEAE